MLIKCQSLLQRNRRFTAGFSLTELVIILGIIGLVLGSLWVAIGQILINNKINKTTQELSTIVQNIRAIHAEQPGIKDTGGTTLIQALDQLKAFPLEMRQTTATPTGILFNPWSTEITNGLGTVTIEADNCSGAPNANGAAQPCFGIAFLNVPQNGCIVILGQTTQSVMALQQIQVNGTIAGDINGTPPLPVVSSAASAACNNPTNTILWIYPLKNSNS